MQLCCCILQMLLPGATCRGLAGAASPIKVLRVQRVTPVYVRVDRRSMQGAPVIGGEVVGDAVKGEVRARDAVGHAAHHAAKVGRVAHLLSHALGYQSKGCACIANPCIS